MEIFKILGTIALSGQDKFNSDIDSATSKGKSLSAAVENGLSKAAKIGKAAIGVAATAVGALMKSSISNYAEYEQLVGGVETLFKDSSSTVMKYADNAYKTAGLSANQYMDTVTSFSASLLQSLGNDTAAAAEYGNLAVTDMADNANKMGTNISSIQDAYQGFAKQNYTMLDNLKLGYGGTKSEMERLIADANALNAAQGKATEYSIESFADIVAAIHDVQTEMGITGTTALEAATTIQGSANAAKAAWINLLTGIADENADLDTLISNFATSATTALKNIVPRIGQVISGIDSLREKIPVFGILAGAIETTAIVLASAKIGTTLQKIVTGFQSAQVQLSLYTIANGKAALAQGITNGALTAGEVVVGVLTGKISLATAAQAAWNAVMAANPVVLVVGALTALGVIIAKTVKANNEIIESMAGMAETSEEAAAKVEELTAKVEELEATDPAYWNDALQQELDNTKLALANATEQYNNLVDAENTAAESSGAAAEEYSADADQVASKSEELAAKIQETYTKIRDSVSSWFSPFAQATVNVSTSIADMMAGMQSQMEFNNAYSANLQTLAEYGLGSVIDTIQGMGAEGSAYAAALVSDIEAAGGATSEAGQQIIQNFLQLSEGLVASQDQLAETMTAHSAELFSAGSENPVSAMGNIMKTDMSMEEAGIEAVNRTGTSMQSAVNAAGFDAAGQTAMQRFIQGINSMQGAVMAAVNAIASAAAQRMQQALSQIQAMANSAGGGEYKTGLDYVPYDEFPAILHKGEAVLTASEAAAWRAGKKEGASVNVTESEPVTSARNGITIVQNIHAVPQTPAEFAATTEAYFTQARWAMA